MRSARPGSRSQQVDMIAFGGHLDSMERRAPSRNVDLPSSPPWSSNATARVSIENQSNEAAPSLNHTPPRPHDTPNNSSRQPKRRPASILASARAAGGAQIATTAAGAHHRATPTTHSRRWPGTSSRRRRPRGARVLRSVAATSTAATTREPAAWSTSAGRPGKSASSRAGGRFPDGLCTCCRLVRLILDRYSSCCVA
jgi:hypothetical protein